MPIAVLLLLLWLATAAPARADLGDAQDWYRRAQTLIDTLIGPHGPPRDGVIAAPADIDPKMAIVPPNQAGTLRIIPPPDAEGGGRGALRKPIEPVPLPQPRQPSGR